MFETTEFLCKSFVLAGFFMLSSQTIDLFDKPEQPSMIDGMTTVQPSGMDWEVSQCKKSQDCLKMAEALYFESRSEGWDGMVAVANVIKNRVESKRFRDSVVDVVEKPYQFSYVHEVEDKSIKDQHSYRKALIISKRVLTGRIKDTTMNSTHYLNPKKLKRLPRWAKEFERTIVVNNHHFFKMEG